MLPKSKYILPTLKASVMRVPSIKSLAVYQPHVLLAVSQSADIATDSRGLSSSNLSV